MLRIPFNIYIYIHIDIYILIYTYKLLFFMVEVGDGKILHSPVPFLQHLQLPCREVIYGSFIQSVTHLGSVEEGRKGQAATTRE